MNLQDILNKIALKYPHAYDNSVIIDMVNDAERRIFRTMYKPETSTTYDLIADNPFYPVTYSPENIIDVVVNGVEYPFQNQKYDAQGYFYYITEDNSIGLYPTPTETVLSGLTVFHYEEPVDLEDMTDLPTLDVVWHMMLVYHPCRELAVMARDDMSNTFVAEINDLERQYKKSIQARQHQIQDVYAVGRGPL